ALVGDSASNDVRAARAYVRRRRRELRDGQMRAGGARQPGQHRRLLCGGSGWLRWTGVATERCEKRKQQRNTDGRQRSQSLHRGVPLVAVPGVIRGGGLLVKSRAAAAPGERARSGGRESGARSG